MNEPPAPHETIHRDTSMPSIAILGLLLAFSSSGFVQKYTGTTGLAIYVAAVVLAMFATSLFLTRFGDVLQSGFRSLSLALLALLAVAFIGLHHIEDDRGPGRSSDRDEGLELAVSRMMDGRNPYYPQSEFAGPLSLLPGAIILSVPFAITGSVGLQNVFWLGVFLFVSSRHFHNRPLALTLLLVPLGISPSALYEFLSGGDMLANGIYVSCFMAWAWDCWNGSNTSVSAKLISALLLALGLASRANFILILPLFGAFLWRNTNFRTALAAMVLVSSFYLAIVLPFYLHDPGAFTPLMSRKKLAFAGQSVPWAEQGIIAITVIGSISLSAWMLLRRGNPKAHELFRCCAIVTVIPMVCAVSLSSILGGLPDFGFMHDRFGLMYVFLAILGWGVALSRGMAGNFPSSEFPSRNPHSQSLGS